jgi:hypothetical protein
MDGSSLDVIINAGTAAILLFMYTRLEARFDKLQVQLHETNMRLWSLLEKQLAQDDLTPSQVRQINPRPTLPGGNGA